MRPTLLALLPALLPTLLPAQKGVSLEQLTELARQRAERLRPELEKKFAPYEVVLSYDYKDKQLEIDEAVEKASALGDAIVPLLLEKLEPRRESPALKNLAANVARVLARMEPQSFIAPLMEIAEGDSYTGSSLAIVLLGKTGSERAGALLTRLIDRFRDSHLRRLAYEALSELQYPGAALKVARALPMENRSEELAACIYLATVPQKALVPEFLRILEKTRRPEDVMRYLRLLGGCSGRNAEVAHAMLPYFGNNKLDRTEWRELAQLLIKVSPPKDEKVLARLRQAIEENKSASLSLQAAVTMKALGDDEGAEILQRHLRRETRDPRGKRVAYNWSNLGDFYLAMDDLVRARDAYLKGTRLARSSGSSRLYIQLAKVAARRERWKDVRDALRDSGSSLKVLQAEARHDEPLARAFEQKIVKEYLDSFAGR